MQGVLASQAWVPCEGTCEATTLPSSCNLLCLLTPPPKLPSQKGTAAAHSLFRGNVEAFHQVAAALGEGDGVVAVERLTVRGHRPARLGHVDLHS